MKTDQNSQPNQPRPRKGPPTTDNDMNNDETITLTLTRHDLYQLKALVEYVALSTGDGADATNQTVSLYLNTIVEDHHKYAVNNRSQWVQDARFSLTPDTDGA